MAKQLLFDLAAKEKLLKGIKTLADAVGATLGPLANNVALDKNWGAPLVIVEINYIKLTELQGRTFKK